MSQLMSANVTPNVTPNVTALVDVFMFENEMEESVHPSMADQLPIFFFHEFQRVGELG